MYLEIQCFFYVILFHSCPYNVTYSILTEYKLSVSPEMDIMEYCTKEWRGNTPVAKRMRKVLVLFLSNFVGLFVFICVFSR